MDSTPKRRSLFGFSFFNRAPPPSVPTESPQRAEYYRTADLGQTPPVPRAGFNATPESPVKRASAAQMSTRKIIDRPQGPLSKLSQTTNATDFAQLPSPPKTTNFSVPASTPKPSGTVVRRMPGDNPNKFKTISGSSTSTRQPSILSGTATTPRNMFRASSLGNTLNNDRLDFSFSPKVPSSTIKQTFPPTTPGRPPRGSTAEVNGRGLANTGSTSLFTMRIPSPPRDLTGERIAKEVPEDHNRPGSIYADEFLTHYCPKDFNELQRNQFFCVLDLRRLKYVADEVFAKKDWKINILNFAKEYEKSRSLIMLHYGLYEFKTVKASEIIKKQWQKEHGIPTSDDEKEELAPTYKPNGTQGILARGKRKAEEDLAPKDTASAASSANLNKRRIANREPLGETSPTANKAKRKADVVIGLDENPTSKLVKVAPSPQKASAVKSLFEKIANGTSNENPTSSSSIFKPTPNPFLSKPTNGNLGRSVFDAAAKPVATHNPFGHLSDVSKGSGNDDADAESEDSSDRDADAEAESEVQEASASDEPSVAASGGVDTPRFGTVGPLFVKKAIIEAPSSTSSEAGENSKGKSLFDRITYGSDGQPVRLLAPAPLPPQEEEKSLEPTPSEPERSVSPTKEPSTAPTNNNTWNIDTPIKFAPGPSQPSSLLGSAADKPGPLNPLKDALGESPSSTPAASFTSAAGSKENQEPQPAAPSGSSTEGPKTTAPETKLGADVKSIFSSGNSALPTATPMFGSATVDKPTDAGSKLFSTSGFGQPNNKPSEDQKSTPTLAATPSPSRAFEPLVKTVSAAQPSNLFGSTTKPQDSKPAIPPASTNKIGGAGFFGASTFGANTPKPTRSLFAPTEAASTPKEESSEASAKSLFGTAPKNDSSEAQPKSLFGTTTGPSTSSGFGMANPPTAPETKSIFGTATPSVTSGASTSKPIFSFGGAPATQDEPPKTQSSIFANAPAPAPVGSIFKFAPAAQSTAPVTFGSGGSQPQLSTNARSTAPIFGGASASSSFTFTPEGAQASFNNPFSTNGSSSAPSSFNFSSDTTKTDPTASQPAATTPFVFGGGGSTQTPSISFGASGATAPAASPSIFGTAANGGSSNSMFKFGGSQSQPSGSSLFTQQKPLTATAMFGSGLAPIGGGTSTGTNSPFTFGGASSLATTPATGTPEPSAEHEDGQGTQADGDDAPQEQISLTEGGPGEEDESAVHEVRAKAVKLVMGGNSDSESSGAAGKDKKNPWQVQGVGLLRLLKHKNTGAVRMLLRAEPRGHVALNKTILPDLSYKPEPNGGKYVKITTTNDAGTGLETWMLQVKTKELAQSLADALEANKAANKKN